MKRTTVKLESSSTAHALYLRENPSRSRCRRRCHFVRSLLLNKASLNISKNAQKRITGHAQFEFFQKKSQVYTNRNDRVLNIFYRLSCISMIRPNLITSNVRALSLTPLKCVSKRETNPILEIRRFILVNKWVNNWEKRQSRSAILAVSQIHLGYIYNIWIR